MALPGERKLSLRTVEADAENYASAVRARSAGVLDSNAVLGVFWVNMLRSEQF
jgi:hypothetical protein